jgi:HlyD family secretion protein
MNDRTNSRTARHLCLLSTTFLIGLLAAGCGAAEKEKEPIVAVTVATPERSSISAIVSAEAVVFPVQQSVITPKITSTIREFLVQRGSKVRKGQLLAVLENADLAAAAEQSKGEFEQAEASYATTVHAGVPQQMQKAQLDLAAAKAGFDAQQKIYDSRKDLFAQGALPRRDLDAAEVALAQARAQYEVAEKQLADLNKLGEREALKSADGQMAAAKGKFMGSKAALSYSEIRSPLNGVVTERPQYAGELAAANQPLMTLMDLSRLIAKAHISRTDAATLNVGNAAELKVQGSDDIIHGHVSLVSPALDAGSTTVEIWVEVSKPGDRLKPGMTVQVSIVAQTLKDALVVPASALFKSAEGEDYVMLAGSDQHAHEKIVRVGVRNGDEVQIAEGLTASDRVIVTGGYGLPDKTQIKLRTSADEDTAPARNDDDKAPAPTGAKKPDAPDKD